MKLLILSDSHREMEYMRDAVRRERPDAVIHLGDLVPDADRLAEKFPGLPVLSVRGNCDFSQPPRAEELLRTFEGVKIFGVHGHRYRVKQTLLPVEMAARQNGADVLLFGHTHCPYCEYYNGLWMLNPGACSGRTPSYGVVQIENGTVNCRVTDLYAAEEKVGTL